jgi:hypothetical protein
MGWPQPTTLVQTDNSTACGIANDNIKQQRSRSIDMRFYWVRDRKQQGHFDIIWHPGKTNLADYYSKHHSAAHHQDMRSTYLHIEGTKGQSPAANLAYALSVAPAGTSRPWSQDPHVNMGAPTQASPSRPWSQNPERTHHRASPAAGEAKPMIAHYTTVE